MADGDSTWVICKELLVVPVPSGLLMLTNRTEPIPDPTVMTEALHQPPLHDAVGLYLGAGAEMSVAVQRYVSALSGPERDQLVMVPWPWPGLTGTHHTATPPLDTKTLEGLADFYGVRVHAGPGLAPSPRIVSVDVDELETPAPEATAVRVLPRVQTVMRGTVHTAVDLAVGEQPPSWQRLEQYLRQAPQIRTDTQVPWPVESPSTVPFALGVYLARYGAPAGGAEALHRSVAPVTSAQLYEVLGGNPVTVDPHDLFAGLLDAPGSAVLVRSTPRGAGPDRLTWLMSDGGPEPRLWWVEPPDDRAPHPDGATMSVALADPASDDRRMAVLLDPRTRVVPVDPAGRATTFSPAPPVPADPNPVDPIPAPAGTRYVESVLVVDTGESWPQRADILARIAHAARDAQRPVVAVNTLHGLAENSPELTALHTVLRRYQRLGVRPVVVATSNSKAFAAVRAQYRPVTVQPRTDGLDQSWHVIDPLGNVYQKAVDLTPALFTAADAVHVAPDGLALPPVLARWLAQRTWPDAERYLREHAAELLQPDVEEALHHLRLQHSEDREVGAYDVILRLVRAAGGVADPSEPRFVPPATTGLTADDPDPVLPEPLRETFAFDYLRPHASTGADDNAGDTRKLRKPWDDQLLWLMYLGGRERGPAAGNAWVADMAALARGLDEPGKRRVVATDSVGNRAATVVQFNHGHANATVFTAVSTVLGFDPDRIRALAAHKDPVNADPDLQRAVGEIQSCQISPVDRVAWVVRMKALDQQITDDSGPDLAGLLTFLTEALASCR